MARTIYGNCTGRAARVERQELAEQIEESRLRAIREFEEICLRMYALDPAGYAAWIDGQAFDTRRELVPLMVARIWELELAAASVSLLDTADWTYFAWVQLCEMADRKEGKRGFRPGDYALERDHRMEVSYCRYGF